MGFGLSGTVVIRGENLSVFQGRSFLPHPALPAHFLPEGLKITAAWQTDQSGSKGCLTDGNPGRIVHRDGDLPIYCNCNTGLIIKEPGVDLFFSRDGDWSG